MTTTRALCPRMSVAPPYPCWLLRLLRSINTFEMPADVSETLPLSYFHERQSFRCACRSVPARQRRARACPAPCKAADLSALNVEALALFPQLRDGLSKTVPLRA